MVMILQAIQSLIIQDYIFRMEPRSLLFLYASVTKQLQRKSYKDTVQKKCGAPVGMYKDEENIKQCIIEEI